MIGKIGTQDGISATQNALTSRDAAHATAYAKQADTLKALKAGHNETIDFRTDAAAKLAAMEGQLSQLPFLRPPVSTAPGA